MAREFINPPDLATPPSNIYNHVVKVGTTKAPILTVSFFGILAVQA